MAYNPETIRNYFDALGKDEWSRFDHPRGRVDLHIHTH
jgi:hypothetical protein